MNSVKFQAHHEQSLPEEFVPERRQDLLQPPHLVRLDAEPGRVTGGRTNHPQVAGPVVGQELVIELNL